MVVGALVQVARHGKGKDRFEVRRPLDGRLQLGHREVADADHADVSVAPRLSRDPLHEVMHVLAFLGVEEVERALGAAGAAQVGDDVHVTARHPEVRPAGLDEPRRGAEVLHLPRVWRGGQQRREAAVGIGSVNVGQKRCAVPHGDRDVDVGA